MTKTEKLLAKMANNPRDWSIDEIKTVAKRYHLTYRQPGTSHVTFRDKRGRKLTIPAHKPIKAIYVKKFIIFIDGSEE